jgi:hypothetical protein
MKVLVAGEKMGRIQIVNKKDETKKIVEYETEISRSAKLLHKRGCQIIEVEDENQFLDAMDNNPDLDGVIIDASFRGGKLDSLDVIGNLLKKEKIITCIIETQPSASDHLFAAIDGIELTPLPINACLQNDLDSFRESGKWKAWAKHWVFNDAGDTAYLLLQDIYPNFSSEWWFSKAAVDK